MNPNDVYSEYLRAKDKHPSFNSAHEGYAVILEELDELWKEVRKKKERRSKDKMRDESIQIAAMAMRFINDICDVE